MPLLEKLVGKGLSLARLPEPNPVQRSMIQSFAESLLASTVIGGLAGAAVSPVGTTPEDTRRRRVSYALLGAAVGGTMGSAMSISNLPRAEAEVLDFSARMLEPKESLLSVTGKAVKDIGEASLHPIRTIRSAFSVRGG